MSRPQSKFVEKKPALLRGPADSDATARAVSARERESKAGDDALEHAPQVLAYLAKRFGFNFRGRILEIDAGEYDLQRFVYHFFMKCFWNPELSYADNVAVNYDWYHPQLATRHTLPEVEEWFQEAALKIVHRNVDYYGITVRGTCR